MADDKQKEPTPAVPKAAVAPAPAQAPVATPIPDEKASKTYYLRPGVKHVALIKGERITLDTAGQPAELSESQYKAMSDRFFTEAEYAAFQESQAARAEGANAAEVKTDDEAGV